MLSAAVMIGISSVVVIALGIVAWQFVWVGLLCVLVAMFGSVGRYLHWRCINFVVTTDRIIVRQGVLSKSGLEIPLDRVMNISYHQALWERILGSGDLVVESAGESGHQFFSDVADPSGVQNLIYRQVEAYQERQGNGHNNGHGLGGGSDSREPSIPEQIEKLDELRQRGILSTAEFEEKKQELLDRL